MTFSFEAISRAARAAIDKTNGKEREAVLKRLARPVVKFSPVKRLHGYFSTEVGTNRRLVFHSLTGTIVFYGDESSFMRFARSYRENLANSRPLSEVFPVLSKRLSFALPAA